MIFGPSLDTVQAETFMSLQMFKIRENAAATLI